MKIRSDFVSNSSSSSFVMVGFKVDKGVFDGYVDVVQKLYDKEYLDKAALESHAKKPWDELDEDDKEDVACDIRYEGEWSIADGSDDGIDDGGMAIGFKWDVGEDGFSHEIIPLTEFFDDLAEMKIKLKIESEPVFITGIRCT